jgi:anti-sigma factor RsiW
VTHDDAVQLLPAYVDAELERSSVLAMEEHLGVCEACRSDCSTMANMKAAVRHEGRHYAAPRSLRAAFSPRPLRSPGWWASMFDLGWAKPALALGLAAVVSSLITLQLAPSTSEGDTEEIVSNHVRSLMANHLVDVPSEDTHTVKPWFAGRLDFSPPVEDFAAKGYPLIGGRLEYLERQPVAALVYRKDRHLINVYVRPNDGGPVVPVKENPQRGFNLISWSDTHFKYAAVSDLNAAELRQLAEDLGAPGGKGKD